MQNCHFTLIFTFFTSNLSFAWPVAGQPLLISLQVNNKSFIESLELKPFLFDQDPKKNPEDFNI
jgi:hypothetical protein